MNLKTLFINQKTVASDGAMGTYFSELSGLSCNECEKHNVISPDVIRRIHSEYIAAGAKLIRTNTFSANSITGGYSRESLRDILTQGYHIAAECAGENAVVCADVSAIYAPDRSMDEILEEYRFIVDTFLSCGAETFIFETLSELGTVLPAINYIISVKPDAEIIVSFALLPDGCTRSGTSCAAVLESIRQNAPKLTMAGLNCGSGAAQMIRLAVPFLSYIQQNTDLYTIVMPNAGYPAIENRRTVFTATPLYFAQRCSELIACSVSAIGGCCGTEPSFIAAVAEMLQKPATRSVKSIIPSDTRKKNTVPRLSSLIADNEFVIAAELDPPNNSDFTKMLHAAAILKESGVNIITVSDSPLGHAKADPVVCSARIKREIGIEVLPHICCRDRNINAVRSILLGAHSEGIRAVLAVTGDHIAETDRGIIKPVFNMDSVRLMELISKLNADVFSDSPMMIGGAYDPQPRKTEYSLKRLQKKKNAGLSFVLTQPVFSESAIASIDKARQCGVKVLAGIMPMVSLRNASYMKNEVPGMDIPDALVERFRPDMTREEAAQVGIEIAAELARMMKSHADGFYFVTPFNRAEIIKSVLEAIGQTAK